MDKNISDENNNSGNSEASLHDVQPEEMQPHFAPASRTNTRLVLEAQKGNEEAIARVIELYYQDMLYFAQKKVGRQDGEDVTQQTIARLITKLGDLKEPAKLKSWLMKSLHYECLDFLRKKKRVGEQEVVVMLDDDFNGSIEDRELPADALLINEENKTQLIGIIDGLPQRFADVIRLRYLEDMSMAEIADVLEIDRKKVYNDIYRGLRLCEERLKEQTGERRFFAVGAAGAIPLLTEALQADMSAAVTPQMIAAGMEATRESIHAQLGASASSSTAGAAKHMALGTKIAIGSAIAVVVVAAGVIFALSQAPAEPEVVTPTPVEAGPVEAEEEQQQEQPIITVADMIGDDYAELLDGFVANGTDPTTWTTFLTDIGAEPEVTSFEPEYQYDTYLLTKQDKQLLLVERKSTSGEGIVEVRYQFGPIEELPNQMVTIHMFD